VVSAAAVMVCMHPLHITCILNIYHLFFEQKSDFYHQVNDFSDFTSPRVNYMISMFMTGKREDTPSLLSEFCCQQGMTWMKDFQRHGVEVGFERCRSWDDECCVLRVAKGSGS
jgi:hypothetical protein